MISCIQHQQTPTSRPTTYKYSVPLTILILACITENGEIFSIN